MTRRTFWQALCALVGAPAVVAARRTDYYGPMTVNRWHYDGHFKAKRRVFCDGVDVTNRCFFFDDRIEEAHVYTTQPPQINRATGRVDTKVLHGIVEVRDRP